MILIFKVLALWFLVSILFVAFVWPHITLKDR
jgi:uncharacterized membrane protein